jgi:hypothetical protein
LRKIPNYRVTIIKVALFCIPASGGTFSSYAIQIIKWVKKIAVAKAKVIPHLEDVERGTWKLVMSKVTIVYYG